MLNRVNSFTSQFFNGKILLYFHFFVVHSVHVLVSAPEIRLRMRESDVLLAPASFKGKG